MDKSTSMQFTGISRYYFPDVATMFEGMFAHYAGPFVKDGPDKKLINGLPCRQEIGGFDYKQQTTIVLKLEDFSTTEPVLVRNWHTEFGTEKFYLIP